MKIFSPILKGTTTVSQGTTNLSGSFTGSLLGTAATASYADNFTVGGTLTAQTINVQIITSSIEFNTGSTRNGALSSNTHQFTGSVLVSGSITVGGALSGTSATFSSVNAITVNAGGAIINSTYAGTDGNWLTIQNAGGVFYTGLENSVGTSFGATAYAGVLYLTGARNLEIFTSGVRRLTVTSAGNVGIGTTSPTNSTLEVRANADNISWGSVATLYGYLTWGTSASFGENVAIIKTPASTGVVFQPAGTERMRITSGGYLKASNDGTYVSSTGAYHELRNSANQPAVFITNTKSSGTEEIIRIKYTAFSPNGNTNWFLYADDSTAARFYVTSNGGIGNYQGNNTNLSDERTKKDIIPLESYWNKFKDIEIVKFKYKDQTHDDFNIGVISQQVEQVAPEFVDIDGFGQTPEDGIPLKSIYTADLYHATIKVLQEAMIKIEELSAENDTLKEILQRNNIQ